MKKIYEFLLWNNCGNNCTFCHQRQHERKNLDKILNPQEQINSINKCLEFLNTVFEKGNHVLLVGGEIFDIKNIEVKSHLQHLFSMIINMMEVNEIELLYLNTNLLYTDLTLLTTFLDKIEKANLFHRLKFATSYDIIGRYSSFERELLFYKNLKYLTDGYKDLNIVVNTVLTKEACNRIVSNDFGADFLLEYLANQGKSKFTIKDWIEYFKVEINTIPNIILNYEKAPDAAKKTEIFNTLLHIDKLIPGYLNKYAENIALMQEKLLYEYNKFKNEFVYCSSKLSKCGHSENFKQSFIDSVDCYPCEIKRLAKHNIN